MSFFRCCQLCFLRESLELLILFKVGWLVFMLQAFTCFYLLSTWGIISTPPYAWHFSVVIQTQVLVMFGTEVDNWNKVSMVYINQYFSICQNKSQSKFIYIPRNWINCFLIWLIDCENFNLSIQQFTVWFCFFKKGKRCTNRK